ncbi:MAG: IS1182 family transposase [Planctomycetes bacterium]|nr:IS1182 family transposase [Planctomycetota bacterium]
MGTHFRPYEPDQDLLFPPSPRDWLPDGHLAYFVSDTVDALDLEPFYRRYRGSGRRASPHEPRMLLKVLIYGYCSGVFSSRKIARGLEDSVAFRYLAGGNNPSHRTICRFRQEHLADFQGLFVQVVRIAREVGLIQLGTVAVDGSKVKANASKHKAMSYERMQKEEKRLRKEIRRLTNRASQVDAEEDALFGPDFRGDEIPAELERRQDRLQKIREAKARLEARQREEDEASGRSPDDGGSGGRGSKRRPFGRPEDRKQDNFTDPDSRIMGSPKKGFEQAYNAQVGVDGKRQLIVSNGVGNNAADVGELLGQVDQVKSNLGGHPQRALADAGYKSEDNFRGLEERGIRGYVALGKGESAPPSQVSPEQEATGRMARRLRSKGGRSMYKKRKHVVEPAFGWIKQVLGFRSFSVRSLPKAQGEWSLVCLATNLRRLNGMMRWA